MKKRGGARKAAIPREAIAEMGKVHDYVIASTYHLPCSAVARERLRRKIKAHQWPGSGQVWRLADLASLGRESDVEVSMRLGISVQLVAKRRRALGIPPAPHPHAR